MPPIHIHLSAQTQQAVSQASGVISEIKNNSLAKVTPVGGNNTRDAIIRFPAEAQQEPIYISIIDVIPAAAQKQLNEQAKKQQTVWGLESLLNQLNAALPSILSTDYKLLDFTDEENALLRRNNYAAQLAQIKLFEITQTRASAELLEAEAAVTNVKGEPDKATFLLQRSAELRSSIPAMETQLSALNKEAIKIHAQYEIMYKTATERFFRQRAENNQRAVEAYHQQQKEERENYLQDAMAAANIKSAEQIKQEIEATLQEITIPSIDRKRLEIIDFLNPIIPEARVPKPEIAIPSFNFPPPPNFMPQKSLAERQEWAQIQLSVLGTVALRGFSSSEPTSRSPLSFAGHKTGSVTFAGEGAASLWRQAAEVRQILQQTSHPLPAAAMLTAISTVDSDISTIMLAVEVLGLSSEKALMHANDTAELSLTAQLVQLENQLGIALVRHPQSVAVPVVNMSMWPDTATGFYRYELADDAGVRVTVLITPDKAPGTEPLSPEVPEIPEAIIHTGNQSGSHPVPIIITLPPAGETGYRELILLPPSDSGLKPIYIMFNNPRKLPGEVTGYGEEINGHWLNPSSRNEGAPIPAQIADILRGQTFSNFDVFREAFWIAVANNPELSKEFSSRNLSFMKRGYSPFVPNKDKAGGREKYEPHHIKSIKDGGAVFDVDNIGVLTPKRHIEIHTKKEDK